MTSFSISERRQIVQIKLGHAKHRTLARISLSPFISWSRSSTAAEQLLLVPQELRTSDAGFVHEVRNGMFGLGGTVASMGKGSVFDIKPPSETWAKDLHGFTWLRHLSASGSQTAITLARHSVDEWLKANRHWHDGLAWLPEVTGRRVFSWIANAELLLADCEPDFYDRVLDSLGRQMMFLSSSWYCAAVGLPRLIALIGLTTGDFCIAGRTMQLERSERRLAAEIQRQIYDDGGHVSRNPHAVVELLLDLLPLRSCYQSYHRELPEPIASAILKMLRFLQFMRLGDGSLAHFHGTGAPPFHNLATLAAYIDTEAGPANVAPQSCYARLTGGDTIVLMDGGGPPSLPFAASAAACCLAFELSAGVQPIFVNGGTPGPAEQDWLARSRATASHNTLVLGAQSSSEIVKDKQLAQLLGGMPLRLPEKTSMEFKQGNEATIVEAQHDGYRKRFGLLHRRRLKLAPNGRKLEGLDQITPAAPKTGLPRDIPFSIHFHLHPTARCLPETSPVMLQIKLPDGAIWQFDAEGATLSVEESIYYADLVGPAHAQQIVLRGSCFGDQSIRWRVAKVL